MDNEKIFKEMLEMALIYLNRKGARFTEKDLIIDECKLEDDSSKTLNVRNIKQPSNRRVVVQCDVNHTFYVHEWEMVPAFQDSMKLSYNEFLKRKDKE